MSFDLRVNSWLIQNDLFLYTLDAFCFRQAHMYSYKPSFQLISAFLFESKKYLQTLIVLGSPQSCNGVPSRHRTETYSKSVKLEISRCS